MPDRQDLERVTLTIDGVDYGVWDTFGGGETEADDTKYRPGGTPVQRSLGGPVSTGNVTLGRLYELARDHRIIGRLRAKVGRGRAVITRQPLDDGYRVPAGSRPETTRGTVQRVKGPDVDSNSNDPKIIEVEVSVDGTPTS